MGKRACREKRGRDGGETRGSLFGDVAEEVFYALSPPLCTVYLCCTACVQELMLSVSTTHGTLYCVLCTLSTV